MTKRFTYVKSNSVTQYQALPIQEIGKGKALHCKGVVDKLNKLSDENEQLKSEFEKLAYANEELLEEKRIWKQMSDEYTKLSDENEELKKDATILIYANQDYRKQNQTLQKQLNYIQNSINNAINHQKTELGQKALQEIIADYNEWMLGHKEAKE